MSKTLFAAVKMQSPMRAVDGRKNWVAQDGMMRISERSEDCILYIYANYNRFLEFHGHCFPALIQFDPEKAPKTMQYYAECPELHIAYHSEAEYLASCMLERVARA